MRGKDFLRTAKRLLEIKGSGAREEDMRTVAGRCYYGLFLTAFEALQSGGAVLTGHGDDHEIVRESVGEIAKTEVKLERVERTLRRARVRRTEADYHMGAETADSFKKASMDLMWKDCLKSVELLDSHSAVFVERGLSAVESACRRIENRRDR